MDTADIQRAPPSAWVPERDLVTLALLGKCVEELGELAAKLGRCIIQGVDGIDPDTDLPENRKDVHDEVADVWAVAAMLVEHLGLDEASLEERAERKIAYLSAWLKMLRDGEGE